MLKDLEFWDVIWAIVLLTAIALGIGLILAPKKVDGYYLSRGQNNNGNVCVYAHWTWHPDEVSFCTDDYQKALEFVTRANSQLTSR